MTITPENLIAYLIREPFQPFVIRLKSGGNRLVDEKHHAATGRKASYCTVVRETGGFETIRFKDIAEIANVDTAAR